MPFKYKVGVRLSSELGLFCIFIVNLLDEQISAK